MSGIGRLLWLGEKGVLRDCELFYSGHKASTEIELLPRIGVERICLVTISRDNIKKSWKMLCLNGFSSRWVMSVALARQ